MHDDGHGADLGSCNPVAASCYWGLGWLSGPWETGSASGSPNIAAAALAPLEKKAMVPSRLGCRRMRIWMRRCFQPRVVYEEADGGMLPLPGLKQGTGDGAGESEVTSAERDIEL